MTIDERLKIIEQRCEKATPGPWTNGSTKGACVYVQNGKRIVFGVNESVPGFCRDEDGVFIAASRTDVPALCRALRKAIEQRDDKIRRSNRLVRDIKNLIPELDAEVAAEWAKP